MEGETLPAQPDPLFASNAEETDTRVWLHATQILILSPDTDVYFIGLPLQCTQEIWSSRNHFSGHHWGFWPSIYSKTAMVTTLEMGGGGGGEELGVSLRTEIVATVERLLLLCPLLGGSTFGGSTLVCCMSSQTVNIFCFVFQT